MATVEIGVGTAATLPLAGTEVVTLKQGALTVVTPLSNLPAGSPAADSITNTMLANMADSTIKGRASGAGTGDPTDLTAAQVCTITQGTGALVDSAGFRGIPQNSQGVNYTLVLADAGKHILHPSGGGAGDTFTIPANGTVAFPIGAVVAFINRDSNAISIAITTDTLIREGTTTTGTRTLAQNGIATATKVEATVWIISGGSALT